MRSPAAPLYLTLNTSKSQRQGLSDSEGLYIVKISHVSVKHKYQVTFEEFINFILSSLKGQVQGHSYPKPIHQ